MITTPIAELGEKYQLAIRTMTVLRDANVETIDDLANKTVLELMRDPRCGFRTINEIRWLLRRFGLKLKKEKK